jgi:hypothetical protein
MDDGALETNPPESVSRIKQALFLMGHNRFLSERNAASLDLLLGCRSRPTVLA